MPKRNIYDSIKLDNLLDLCDIPDNDPILKHVNIINQLKPLLDNIKSTCLQLKNISDKEHINLTQKINIHNLVITYKNLSKLI